ncbi:Rha family phage regulatory protein [Planomicrobium stackebrandtii]|uniref:Rha family phage regulatory protein n=1 Tax=Planomicrobium stackebrandtii TaxID=253160 RepID=A0ABU0GRZ5_9BACL|nr:Rha family transcriptional regulator [Planomicrobium stackebrandtii]MDQ0427719.1 Rha family phage regulatory protein [Planomicrobium stackebrandtii]
MENLLVMHNDQAVTSSTNIAENFNKRHDHVMRDIQNLADDVPNFGEMFFKTVERDKNNRNRWIYLMNRDGFTLLAMGFTGSKALHFKLEYINAFKEMEKALIQPKQLSEKEQLMASMRLSLETAGEIEVVKKEIAEVRDIAVNQVTLDHGEQRRLQKAVAIKVYEIETDPAGQRRMFKELYREIKDRFAVASYKDVKRKDLQNAIRYVDAWLPRKVS